MSKIMLQATPSSSTPKSEIPVKTSGGGFLAGGLCGAEGTWKLESRAAGAMGCMRLCP